MDRHSARARDRQSLLTARIAGIAALTVSIGAGMASNVLFLAAFQFRLDWFRDPIRILGAGPASAELFRWASVLDLIGYYLATGVLAYVLWQWLRSRNPLVADLSALAAGGYVLAGGIGAAALAMVGPMLMHATPKQQCRSGGDRPPVRGPARAGVASNLAVAGRHFDGRVARWWIQVGDSSGVGIDRSLLSEPGGVGGRGSRSDDVVGLGAAVGPGEEGVGLRSLGLRRRGADGVVRADDHRAGEGRLGGWCR